MTDASAPNGHALFLIALLTGQPTPAAFRAECQRIVVAYVEAGMEAGWSREVAEEFAEAEIERVAETLSALRSRFIPTAGRC
ncbi:hypothetical protein [Azospirillum sp. TSO35-2]|uniref:hypothetical protein n=1 Tax=Azospirillum sp. TSO35-2 TaxID=716796 RepID=UPI000D60E10D|nr:hypothetical protein [Azospirillum sp. TSO35-2]PWC39267.1 hypothetical protein TSO352_03475 [Azospirillum sp. TSO35-2]